ncbi:endonuclease/exonuclease/phosphatase family protein [Spirillospora sp. NPDC052269]
MRREPRLSAPVRMQEDDRLSIASLNTLGIPLVGGRLTARCAAIAAEFEASDIDVVCFQEVFSYHHLRLLTTRMPSFSHVVYRPSLPGPAGGLVTVSRRSLPGHTFRRFANTPTDSGLSRYTRFKASLRGCLITRPAGTRLAVVNTHPMANTDKDWSEGNRFHTLQQGQLAALADAVRAVSVPAVVCGDFNVARDSDLFRDFIRDSDLTDAFAGSCPPTFHAEYATPGHSTHCIDFILHTEQVEVDDTGLLFTTKRPMPGGPGYVSDHLGLRATVGPGD